MKRFIIMSLVISKLVIACHHSVQRVCVKVSNNMAIHPSQILYSQDLVAIAR